MRVSSDRTDPGYREDYRYIEVYLDGAGITLCHTADEEQGFALVYAREPDGVPSLPLALRRLEGRVTIRHTDPPVRRAVDSVTARLHEIAREAGRASRG